MPRAKTPKFNKFRSQSNCFDWFLQEDGFKKFLNSDEPFTLELGCGKAELLLELARKYPNRKFVGVDIKSDRLWRPAQIALEEKLSNIVFIRSDASLLLDMFKPGSIEELWITFPDPFPKKRQAKHRLTHPNFLMLYHRLLSTNGVLHFKTDNLDLFEWSVEELREFKKFKMVILSRNLHQDKTINDEPKIKTTYEKRFIEGGLQINYLELEKLSRAH